MCSKTTQSIKVQQPLALTSSNYNNFDSCVIVWASLLQGFRLGQKNALRLKTARRTADHRRTGWKAVKQRI